MVRRSRDLFVVLAERQQRSQADDGTDPGEAVREAGGRLGRWVQGAVKSMRPSADAKRGSRGRSKSRGRGTRHSSPVQVPRGLLVPGWLLMGMVTVGIGGGFVVGRYTAGLTGDAPLRLGNAERPRQFDRPATDLNAAQEAEQLSAQFYVCGTYSPQEHSRALRLAGQLRDHGISNARVRGFLHEDGSISRWATLCYVASKSGAKPTLEALQRLQVTLGFQLLLLEGSYLIEMK